MSDDNEKPRSWQGRLNTFQKTMLDWNSLHAYNAVHVARVPGVPDQQRLRSAIEKAINARSLAGLTLSHSRGTYCYCGRGPTPEIKILECGKGLRESLAKEIEWNLNAPFNMAGPFSPFRFFVATGNGYFHLGIAYLHAVADAESVVLLLRDSIGNFTGNQEQVRPEIPGGGRAGQKNLLRSKPGIFLRKMAEFPSQLVNLRRSCRPMYRDATDLSNGFVLFPVEPELLRRLVQASKSWGTTVNDVLLALLMKSCTPLAVLRAQTGRRTRISVGCIVNARKDISGDDAARFGLFLGSFLITHELPDSLSIRDLSTDIGGVTSRIKRKRLYLATALELSVGRFMLSFFSTERRKKLYQKHYPLWGGLTNMNINSLWLKAGATEPADYIRAVSTGPVTPLVLSFTTSGQAANIGLSYRTTVFSPPDIERLKACLLESLANLEAQS